MPRRAFSLILCIFLLLLPLTPAGAQTLPSNDVFSVAHDRLQTALARARPVSWRATVAPTAMDGYSGGTMTAMASLLSAMSLQGVIQAFRSGGGYLEATAAMDGREVATIGQTSRDGRAGINLTGEWISVAQGMELEAAAMLELDAFGQSLLTMDYSGLRRGDMPFLTPIYEQGLRLWALASPYSEDNNRGSAPSGSTSHASTYSIDTEALRTMLDTWVGELSMDGLSLGIPGTDMALGVSEEAFDAFVAKARRFAETIELAKPITLSTTFGEGDVLRTAKGSGTLLEDGKRTPISYSYSYNQSSTRTTRKYSIDFQPRSADTLTLTCTWLTSSNGKSSGAHEVSINASGTYDGKPYRISINVDLVNKFSVGDDGLLTENITGTTTASLKYDGVTIADVTVTRNSTGVSSDELSPNVDIVDMYDVLVKDDQGIKFAGLVTIEQAVSGALQTIDNPLETARKLEETDFMAVELLRDALRDTMAQARQRLVQALPVSVLGSLLQAY